MAERAPSNEAGQVNAMMVVVMCFLDLRLSSEGLTRVWLTVFGGGSWELTGLIGYNNQDR